MSAFRSCWPHGRHRHSVTEDASVVPSDGPAFHHRLTKLVLRAEEAQCRLWRGDLSGVAACASFRIGTGDLPAVPFLERRHGLGARRPHDGAAGAEGATGRLVER